MFKGPTTYMTAAGITLGLAYMMQGLVAGQDELELNPDPPRPIIDITFKAPVQEPVTTKFPQPLKPEEVPEKPELPKRPVAKGGGTILNITPKGPTVDLPKGPILSGPQNGDMILVVGISPDYPRNCQSKGIEGYATVSLTVDIDGTVLENSVVLLESSHSCFNRSALKTAAKFKYHPKMVNGVPQQVHDVMYRFTFELQE